MLFYTVYGAELFYIYSFIEDLGVVTTLQVYEYFLPHNFNGIKYSTKNIDDALSYLQSAYMIVEKKGKINIEPRNYTFRLQILENVKRIATLDLPPKNDLDPLYYQLLNELYIQPNRLFLLDFHLNANQLEPVKKIGGLSKEKMQAWRRVLVSLGIGYRIGKGFQCVLTPQLTRDILSCWQKTAGNLHELIEEHFSKFTFIQTKNGRLPLAISEPLRYLHSKGEIALEQRQDSTARPYFGEKRIRYIRILELRNEST